MLPVKPLAWDNATEKPIAMYNVIEIGATYFAMRLPFEALTQVALLSALLRH